MLKLLFPYLLNSIFFLPKAGVSSAIQQTANIETISNVLSDISSKPIIGKMHRIVKAQVKNHSALKKQGKHWAVTALIADQTSSIEVCFDSEVNDVEKDSL